MRSYQLSTTSFENEAIVPVIEWKSQPKSEAKSLDEITIDLMQMPYVNYLEQNEILILGDTKEQVPPATELTKLIELRTHLQASLPNYIIFSFLETASKSWMSSYLNMLENEIQSLNEQTEKFAVSCASNPDEDSRLNILSIVLSYLMVDISQSDIILDILLENTKIDKNTKGTLLALLGEIPDLRQEYLYPPSELKAFLSSYKLLEKNSPGIFKTISSSLAKSALPLTNQFQLFFVNNDMYANRIYASKIDLTVASGAFPTYPKLMKEAITEKDLKSYNNSFCSLETMSILYAYLKKNNLIREEEKEMPNRLIMGNGSTELYDMAIRSIINEDEHNTVSRPVFIMPVPTYGLFIKQAHYNKAEVYSLELLKEHEYKVNPAQLKHFTDEINAEKIKKDIAIVNLRLSEIFDALEFPDEERFELKSTKSMESIINQLNAFSKLLKHLKLTEKASPLLYPGRVLGVVILNPHNPLGSVYTQDEVDALSVVFKEKNISVIADHVHQHINPDKLPIGSFANLRLDYPITKTYLLLSPSKHLGAANARLGIMHVSGDISKHVQDINLHSILSVGMPKQKMLAAAYQDSPELSQYINFNNEVYGNRRDVVDVLVNGVKPLKCLQHINKMFVSESKKKTFLKLIDGLPNVKQLTKCKASFFTVLDFSYWKNSKIDTLVLDSGIKFAAALYLLARVFVIPNEGMAYPSDNALIARVSFSLSAFEDIVEGFLRMHEFLNNLQPAEPGSKPVIDAKPTR